MSRSTFSFHFVDGNFNPTDIDQDGKLDAAFRETYYNDRFPWRIDADFDVETVALHETGHSLSQGHFGKAFRTGRNGKLHFAPRAVMNAGYTGIQQELTAEQLLPLVYEELRRLTAQKLSHEKPGQTLQATSLVHEAYIRLVGSESQDWDSRGHFFAAAAEAMRRILVDQAHRKNTLKRGGDRKRVELSDVDPAIKSPEDDLIALSEALDQLAVAEPQTAASLRPPQSSIPLTTVRTSKNWDTSHPIPRDRPRTRIRPSIPASGVLPASRSRATNRARCRRA